MWATAVHAVERGCPRECARSRLSPCPANVPPSYPPPAPPREYNWVGLGSLRTVGGKVRRVLAQFTPVSWTTYLWGVMANFRRFCYVVVLVVSV